MELFSINKETGEQELPDATNNDISAVEERDLNQDEEDILKAFRENDAQLEEIGKTIVEELKKVKANAENIETAIDDQGKLLNGLNQRAEANLGEL